jgi:ATP synthase H subunit
MIESLTRIKQSETKAEERMQAAEKEALGLADQAATDARALIAQAGQGAVEETGRMMEKACADARTEAEKIIQAGQADALRIAAQGQGRLDAAGKLIVAHIIGEA